MKINNNLLISGRGEGEGGRGGGGRGGGDKSDWLTEYQPKLVNFSNEHPFGICGQGVHTVQSSVGDRVYTVQYSVGDRVYSIQLGTGCTVVSWGQGAFRVKLL